MRSIAAAISRALRAFSRAAKATIKKTVMIAGRLVTVFLPAAMPVVDELEPDVSADAANDNGRTPIGNASPHQALRNLAFARMIGAMPSAAQLGAVCQMEADWIAAMDAEMAKKVVMVKDDAITAHIRGYANIKGVLAFDERAIADYYRALDIENRRMEHVLGLDQPRQAKMPGGM